MVLNKYSIVLHLQCLDQRRIDEPETLKLEASEGSQAIAKKRMARLLTKSALRQNTIGVRFDEVSSLRGKI